MFASKCAREMIKKESEKKFLQFLIIKSVQNIRYNKK